MLNERNKEINIEFSLVEKIKEEKMKWGNSDGRSFNGEHKGAIIANIVKKHFYLNEREKVDLLSLLKKMNISVERYNFEKLDKSFYDIWGMWVNNCIYVSNKIKKSTSVLFTVAHELGHIFMEHGKGQDVCYRIKNFWRKNEIIMNDFAANLLVPIVDDVFKSEVDDKGIDKVAKKYGVSGKTIVILYERYLNKKV